MSSDATTDEMLIEYAAGGDVEAFEAIVRRYQTRVVNLIRRFLNQPGGDTEDIAQEVFIKCWKKAAQFKGKAKFSTWLFRIVINTCLNHRRGKKPEQPCGSPGDETADYIGETGPSSYAAPHPHDVLEEEERRRIVLQKVRELPRKQRMALILARFEGWSYEEIADLMKVSKGSVDSLVFRARRNLAEKLKPLKEKGDI